MNVSGGSGHPKSWAAVVSGSNSTTAAPTSNANTVAPPTSISTAVPPVPSVVPVPTAAPAATTSASGVESCPTPSPKERGYPLGFRDQAQFDECMGELETALDRSGISTDAFGVRGSSVTFHSNNPNKVGSYFDKRGAKTSDIDVFFVTTDRLTQRPSRTGFFNDKDMAANYPEIKAWNRKWTRVLGRKVAAAGFRPEAPMKPSDAEAIVYSEAL